MLLSVQAWVIGTVPDWIRVYFMWNMSLARRRAVLKRLKEKEKQG